jgi:hypothetical protein
MGCSCQTFREEYLPCHVFRPHPSCGKSLGVPERVLIKRAAMSAIGGNPGNMRSMAGVIAAGVVLAWACPSPASTEP